MPHHHTQRKAQQQRDDLTGEHAVGDAGQVVLTCLFAATWIADTFFFSTRPSSTSTCHLASESLLESFCWFYQTTWREHGPIHRVGEERETPGVIRESVFSVVRHPVYLSEILLYPGLLMLSISLAAAVVWVVAIGFLHYISRYEERLLLERFGEEYELYMREVPMWIPRFRKR